ncbi:sulfatase-like hydrolase/transferase [uncultured Imperialibacter sp.]|uniref:sulfatase-like hydrolase/transferase n=1 Tax=uncultured Imperialibacter sp. TaxID=1672639 RepID=UPI0030DCF4D1|tara:strand:+ start:15229 stop:17565 length:2337 start_codon:yes stop_codon:yes gene_type:complete
MREFKELKWLQLLVINWWGISILLLLFRLYALVGVSQEHLVTIGDTGLTFVAGMANDMVTALCITLALSPIVLLLHFAAPKWPLIWHLPSYISVAALSFGLERYFVNEMTPLGADFWAYSGEDVAAVITASVQVDAILVLGIVILMLSLLFVVYMSKKALPGYKRTYSWVALFALLLSIPLSLLSSRFESLQNQYLAASRMGYFIRYSVGSLGLFDSQSTIALGKYPFEKSFIDADVLGPHFGDFDAPPNLIFIQVEGLGGNFTGAGASMKGFTPFLDSLSEKSLFWPNCLSTTGRTFGIVPALYGSLPLGDTGFMDLGPDYPSHFTLISWLKDNGYSTSYFYGGNINFDKTDIFLEYQGVDNLIYEGRFPESYKKMEANTDGFSWGYPDKALFDLYEKSIPIEAGPRMDMLMTITTHEPFKVPEASVYTAKFDSVVAGFDNKELYVTYRNIFETFLYFDDALRILFDKLSKRADWKNTIVVITGDHRVIPLPQESQLDRFHVPLLIYSPALMHGQTFKAMASHAQVTPSFVSYFKSKYKFPTESKLPFISGTLPIKTDFESHLSLPLMRNKGTLDIYLDNDTLLANDRLFHVTSRLATEPVDNAAGKKRIKEKLRAFKQNQNVALNENRLWEYNAGKSAKQFVLSDSAFQWLEELGVKQIGSDSQLYLAKTLAQKKEYEKARWVAGYLLNNSPNYSDARILIGRTFAWEGKYNLAAPILKEGQRRSPNYEDVYLALADVYFWDGQLDSSLVWAQEGKKRFPNSTELEEKIKRLSTVK